MSAPSTWTGTRTFGRTGKTVSALGLGTWAIGGPAWLNGKPIGWGHVDDAESLRAIQRALDLGITFFDTAPVYGAGRSERLLGQALAGRHDVTIATKFGLAIDEDRRLMTGIMTEPDAALIRSDCEASLRRLNVEAIDLFLCHPSELPVAHAAAVRDILEDLVAEGMIRGHGWSIDDVAGAAIFAEAPHCIAIEHELNLFSDAPDMLALCETEHLASINRSPLAMGLLTGKFRPTSELPRDDVRGDAPAWLQWFADGRPHPEFLTRLDAVREILTADGRTLTQGAIGWIWARSDRTIPIPGFRTVAQVEENAGALRHGPLSPGQMSELDRLLVGDGVTG